MRPTSRLALLALAAASPLTAQEHGEAGGAHIDRRFTFTDETLHGAQRRQHEVEQWATWQRRRVAGATIDLFQFKTEVEYGIDDGFVVAVDLAEWHTADGLTKFDGIGAELKYRFLDPRRDGFGLAYRTEVGIGPHDLEWQHVVIADVLQDRWEFALNVAAELGFEGEKLFDYGESDVAFHQSLGVSYELDPRFYCGVELLHEMPPEYEWGETTNLFVGPCASLRGANWALAGTALALASGEHGEPDFQLRLVFELDL
ncbi:MAG: hypothetical protein U1E73_11515 [Planctomycetota bacterium]